MQQRVSISVANSTLPQVAAVVVEVYWGRRRENVGLPYSPLQI
jgi:hypothetical protein